MITRNHLTSQTLLRVLPLLAAIALVLPACGGEEKGSDLPNATVRGDGQPTADANPTPPPAKAKSPGKMKSPHAKAPATPAGPPPETVIVSVNGDEITQGQIDAEIARMVFRGRPVPPQQMAMIRSRFGPQAEKFLIERKLLEAAVEAEGVEATEEELGERWKEIEKSLPKGMTVDQALQRNGMTKADADEEISRTIQMQKLLDKHAATEPVSDEAAKAHYDKNVKQFTTPEEVRARHILIKLPQQPTDEQKAAAKKQMDEILAELAKEDGKSFEALAQEHSACPSKKQGGDLGFFGRGRMVPEFDQFAFDLEPGVVSEPFLTQFGYHIMEVREKRPARVKPFDEVKEAIKRQLGSGAKQKAHAAYLEKLRAAADIVHSKPAKTDAPKQPKAPMKSAEPASTAPASGK